MQEEFEFEIESHEVYYNEENQELFRAMEKKFNTTFAGVPVVILGDEYVIGNDKAKLEQLVEKYCTSKNSTAILLP